MKKSVLCIGLLLAQTVHAGSLQAPVDLPTAKVLPKGVRNVTLKGVMVAPEERLNGQGHREALGEALNQDLTFAKILEGKVDAVEQGQVEQKMLAANLDKDDTFGYTTGEVNAEVVATVPIFAIGLTNKWTAAVAVPVKKVRTSTQTAVVHQDETTHQSFLAILENTGVATAKGEFDDTIGDPINDKLTKYGYDPLKPEDEYSRLGDVKVVNKYAALENSINMVSLSAGVTLPTGEQANTRKVVDIEGGDGQTDLELGVNHDIFLGNSFVFGSGASYTFQFADHVAARIPEMRSSKLSKDTDENVSRDLGDIAKAEAGIKYASTNGLSIGGGYAFQYKNGDSYSGSEYSAERYEWLEKDSVQNMHSVQLFAGFDTISLFKQGKFAAPLALGITHSRVVQGKNVVSSPLSTLEFKMFF